ncbi:efflux RND transporter periplasmic adaptor subunit [Psychrobium sp. 1_MG-2023]|uniref:efflux RND transporter periplasmic adaptor subunit n=1 Tax=Psychrobium sp. 1_MG-2023 TaxID=3062624 RepID=UPI000C32A425|nr:efflux RND transporter periplasmic adaptor subunit [Psychrobium sp. 1_MG-2023]MDP2561233.1 efflux RND transporter periplasmic adaptor subunit [Psychrobium sp. 1_MG-2023]PKF55264.1 efflux transporter periplasmic adaptor subunit [Alteromonadales bacterium alter-6D02]
MKFRSIIPAGLASVLLVLGIFSAPQLLAQTDKQHNAKQSSHYEGDDHDHTHAPNQAASTVAATQSQHDSHPDAGISLSALQMSVANIKVSTLTPQTFYRTIYAPGEVKANGYTSYVVSPRTESVVISRHATLGEHVVKGQKLVTLFSESVAQAQADYLIAATEWQRVKHLGKKTISDSEMVKAKTAFNAAYGRLIAFGMTKRAIKEITQTTRQQSHNQDINLGQYTLIAQRAGAVLKDDFTQGQRVAAGDTVMLLADESSLWVEAKVSPSKKFQLSVDTPVEVVFDNQRYQGKVIQEAHTIDPITRTRIIRLAVANLDDSLHSGMFVDVNFKFATLTPVMAVPESTLARSADGDWTVFVQDHPGEFNAVEVKLGRSLGQLREISGVKAGAQVAVQGAFFIASEIAKGGFDPHNH